MPEISTNAFSKKTIKRSDNALTGKNVTAGIPGAEWPAGGTPGQGEPGGVVHFKNVSQADPDHSAT